MLENCSTSKSAFPIKLFNTFSQVCTVPALNPGIKLWWWLSLLCVITVRKENDISLCTWPSLPVGHALLPLWSYTCIYRFLRWHTLALVPLCLHKHRYRPDTQSLLYYRHTPNDKSHLAALNLAVCWILVLVYVCAVLRPSLTGSTTCVLRHDSHSRRCWTETLCQHCSVVLMLCFGNGLLSLVMVSN